MAVMFILPWPGKELSPNARLHWRQVAKAKKAYREACGWAAKSQGLSRIEAKRLHLSLLFYPPTRRAFDLDNALARMKSGLDGLADVLGVDDRDWTLTIGKAGEIGGMVEVTMEVLA